MLYQDPYAKRFMKDEKITKTAYIANSGGLLGLCMGFRSAKYNACHQALKHEINHWSPDLTCLIYICSFSLVSAAEILYHCLFGLFRWMSNDNTF